MNKPTEKDLEPMLTELAMAIERYPGLQGERYTSSFSIRKVGDFDSNVPDEEKEILCFSITLRKSLPAGVELMKDFNGIKVFTEPFLATRPIKAL